VLPEVIQDELRSAQHCFLRQYSLTLQHGKVPIEQHLSTARPSNLSK
jgi:hypothetical protein